ncbi:MAG: N-acetyltransferase [Candidatus Syntrophoarchaeum sp. WYZ-LMO15]|nr:MAG: N-acetyltransferase [Candidatus Syntrophoarchaeum sp. WYZ-LMO15]
MKITCHSCIPPNPDLDHTPCIMLKYVLGDRSLKVPGHCEVNMVASGINLPVDRRMIRIRYFRPEDFNRVVEIAEEARLNQDPMLYLELYQLFPDGFFVAEDDGNVVGFVIAIMMVDGGGRIFAVAVKKSHRRRGIATMTLNEAFKMYRKKRTPYVQLEVRVDNYPAQRLYRGLGFVEVGVLPSYYSDGTDALLMRKDLQGSSQPHISGTFV